MLGSFCRISCGLFFTSFIFFWYFVYMFSQQLMGKWIFQWLLNAGVDTKVANSFNPSSYPPWISILNNCRQSLNNLRIFFECMLALTMLRGYQQGVTTGANCVIGSGSVITKDIPANTIAVGNPCKVIRKITDEDKKYYFKKLEFEAESEHKI